MALSGAEQINFDVSTEGISATHNADGILAEDEKKLFIGAITDAFEKKGVAKEYFGFCLGHLLVALAVRGTSPETEHSSNTELTRLKLKDKEVSIDYGDLFKAISTMNKLNNKKNPVRVFARSFSDEYLKFAAKLGNDMPRLVRGDALGLPAEHNYLAADFIVANKNMSDLEQARKLHASIHALAKNSVSDGEPITNLHKFGRGANK